MTVERLQVRILGVVQGVGFRPFVHRLARQEGLPGWVLNDSNGVTVEVEGKRAQLLRFLERLRTEIPPAAWIHALDARFLVEIGLQGFEIRSSEEQGPPRVWVLPDLATCPDCAKDVLDPENRRHDYAFTNCTNCGPRFTIIEGMPYDRPLTSMRGFAMCDRCRAEYEDPDDRRFHAQPNACADCGPQLEFLDRERKALATARDALPLAVEWLKAGRILGVKGLGGYHLMADATDETAVQELRGRKRRAHKPLALMYPDLLSVERHVEVAAFVRPFLESMQAPILILPRTPASYEDIAGSVAPDSRTLGVFLPYTPLHRLLLRAVGRPLVATSANLSEQPMLFDDEEALEHLPRWCDGILRHDRPIVRPADDSVLQVLQRPEPKPQLLRRARGYAPLPVLAPRKLPCILALGGEMNSTFAVSRDREVILSQHLGGLSGFEGRRTYRRVLDDLLRLYELRPTRIAHDLHPGYFTTELAAGLAAEWSVPTVAIQHHHAHLAACVLENELDGPVLGLCWDGTGFGDDGSVWGGEALVGDASSSERVGSLRSFRLPGSDQAARQGWRVALSLLQEVYGEDLPRSLPLFERVESAKIDGVLQMLRQDVNAPRCSSMGRLFDGLAAIVDLCYENTHQAQAPQSLENAAWRASAPDFALPLQFMKEDGVLRLDWEPMLLEVVERVLSSRKSGRLAEEQSIIAAAFHRTLVDAAAHWIKASSPGDTVLAGGVFCNRYLTESLLGWARGAGARVHIHSQLPPTDGSLAAGQLWCAAHG